MLEMYLAIWRVSGKRQVVLILLSLAIAGLAAVPLSYQKDIINLLTEGDISTDRLFSLCLQMMAAILLSLGLKWVMGYRSGVLGEDVIRILRGRIFSGAKDPEAAASTKVAQGTLTTVISAEAEELGKFAGSAYSEPVVQIGTLISVVGYIASTQPGLGLIALMIIAPQVVLVLSTQTRVNGFVAHRVRVLRDATNHIMSADTAKAQRAVLDQFDEIFETRRSMFIWKLSTKFALSAINGLGTVGLLAYGGWLVLQGETDVGTLVAATMGLGRLQGPTAFLIAFYRQVSATRVKFELLRDVLSAKSAHP